MKNLNNGLNRRDFFKTLGVSSIGTLAAATANAENLSYSEKKVESQYPQVPRRKLGKTGIDVPILSLGGMFDLSENQIILRSTLQWGVNYWDTAPVYANTNSENGIGDFLKKNPDVRKKIFLVTKASGARNPKAVEKRLQKSLERLNTNYLDLYYGFHALSNPNGLTDDLKSWSLEAKKKKVIRYFGFSTHTNMTECLMAASKMDWIDVIMTSYNFRLMQDDNFRKAVDACHKAGIGLIAMKVQGHGQSAPWGGDKPSISTDKDKELAQKFLDKGYTEGQAKIKAVLEDERFASACVTMQNIALVTSNVAASLDKTKLSQDDKQFLKYYAQQTCDGYCAGCGNICASAMPQMPYISEVMRYLMYHNSYGEKQLAKQLYADLPAQYRNKIASLDYSRAEAECPQKMPISLLMIEAAKILT